MASGKVPTDTWLKLPCLKGGSEKRWWRDGSSCPDSGLKVSVAFQTPKVQSGELGRSLHQILSAVKAVEGFLILLCFSMEPSTTLCPRGMPNRYGRL